MVATMTYQEVMRQIDQKNNEAQTLIDGWGDTMPTKDQRDEVKKVNESIGELEKQAADFKEGDELRQQIANRKKLINTPVDRVGFGSPGDRPGAEGKARGFQIPQGQTVGDYFSEHEIIQAWVKSLMPTGHLAEAQKIQSPMLPLPTNLKALITGLSDTSAGAMVRTQYDGTVVLPSRPLTIRDIITNGQTGSDIIEFARVVSEDNQARPVEEALAASGASGTKPESDLVLEKATENVKTIAHWLPVTKRALADAPQIRTLINEFLLRGLEEEIEDQMIAGSGSGENFRGILNTSGTLTQDWTTNLLTTTRKARTKLRVTGKAVPTAWVLHPNDFERLDLLEDNEARFYWGGPLMMGTPRLWGAPIVESEAMTEGTAVLGDWRMAVLYDREQAGIQVTDSHQDFFIRNLVAMLAEWRGAFVVRRPASFIEVDLTA